MHGKRCFCPALYRKKSCCGCLQCAGLEDKESLFQTTQELHVKSRALEKSWPTTWLDLGTRLLDPLCRRRRIEWSDDRHLLLQRQCQNLHLQTGQTQAIEGIKKMQDLRTGRRLLLKRLLLELSRVHGHATGMRMRMLDDHYRRARLHTAENTAADATANGCSHSGDQPNEAIKQEGDDAPDNEGDANKDEDCACDDQSVSAAVVRSLGLHLHSPRPCGSLTISSCRENVAPPNNLPTLCPDACGVGCGGRIANLMPRT